MLVNDDRYSLKKISKPKTMIWSAQQLPDTAFSSSSDFNKNHAAKLSRLNSAEGRANWSAKTNDQNQWLQVDLGQLETIVAVAIQGRFNGPQWVEKYNLHISQDEINWERIANVDGVNDQETVAVFQLPRQVNCRYIRFVPQEWHEHISMRVDVAISVNEIQWLSSKIKDSGFSSSSDFNEEHVAKFGRLHLNTGKANWSAKTNDKNQWIQLDIGKIQSIAAVAVQGRFNHKQWVSKYDLHISTDLINWEKFENIAGSSYQDSIVEFNLPQPIQGRYARFLPQEWYKHISMRVDIGVMASSNLSKQNTNKYRSESKQDNLNETALNASHEKDFADAKEIKLKLTQLKADLLLKNNEREKVKKESNLKLAEETAAKVKREDEVKVKAQKESEAKAKQKALDYAKMKIIEKEKAKNQFIPTTTNKIFQPFFNDIFNKLRSESNSKYSYLYNKNEIEKPLEKLCDILEFFANEDFILTHTPFDKDVLKFTYDYLDFDKTKSFDYTYTFEGKYFISEELKANKPQRIVNFRPKIKSLVLQILSRWAKENNYDIFNDLYLRRTIDCSSEFYPEIHIEIAKWVKSNLDKLPHIHCKYYYLSEVATKSNGFNHLLMLNEEFKSRIRKKKQAFCQDFDSNKYHRDFYKSTKFTEVFNLAKSTNDNNFHFSNYIYLKPDNWSEVEFRNHLNLLEFIVYSLGKTDLADELYIDKMEFEKRFYK